MATQSREEGQRDNLERQTGDHDVDAQLVAVGVVGGSCDSTPDGLEEDGDKVAAHKDTRDGPRLQEAQLDRVDGDDAPEAQVDGGGEERRADGQADEVDDEVVLLEDIVVQKNAPDVADDLEDDAARHADEEPPRLGPHADDRLREQEEAEDPRVDGVAGQCRDVFDLSVLLDRAGRVRAVVGARHRSLKAEGSRYRSSVIGREMREEWREAESRGQRGGTQVAKGGQQPLTMLMSGCIYASDKSWL